MSKDLGILSFLPLVTDVNHEKRGNETKSGSLNTDGDDGAKAVFLILGTTDILG